MIFVCAEQLRHAKAFANRQDWRDSKWLFVTAGDDRILRSWRGSENVLYVLGFGYVPANLIAEAESRGFSIVRT